MKKALKNKSKKRDGGFGFQRMFLIFLLCISTHIFSQTVNVNSLTQMLPYLGQDNVDVKLAPGTYSISATDVSSGTFGIETFESGRLALLLFSGSNSIYDFTDVTLNIETAVFQSVNKKIYEINITGNNNVLKNLTLVDVGTVHDAPRVGVINIVMDGSDNRIEGFHMTSKGSYPYGYGDCFGKSPGAVIPYKKHSAFLIRGTRNHALNDTLYHYAFGHCLVMQAATDPKIEGCYAQGEMRSTDEMLAEEGTGTPADLVDFMTTWGYRLPPGYTKSTGEAGIRAYNTGNTIIDGVSYSRGTTNPTILNCFIKNLRVGVTLTHAQGTKYVEGVTAIGTERGFAIGSGDIVDCYADAQYGPIFGVDYDSDKNINAEITVLPYDGETYNGSKYLAYIRGSGHKLTFKSAVANPDQDLKIEFGGDSRTIGMLAEEQNYLANNVTLNNYTNYPIVLHENTNGNSGVSGGMVTDFGTNNNITHISVSVADIEAEDYTAMDGVSTETNGDITNVTSIESGDYMEYEIDVPYSGIYTMNYRVASESAEGNLTLSADGTDLETITCSATGGAQTWSTVTSLSSFFLTGGVHTIRVTSNADGWNLDWMSLLLECAGSKIVPSIEAFNQLGESLGKEEVNSKFVFPGNTVVLSATEIPGGVWSWSGPNGFSADSRTITLNDLQKDQSGEYILSYTNECGLSTSETFTINAQDSWRIEAEDYKTMNGVTVEATSDIDGISDVTSINAGDWIEFDVDVPIPAMYTLDYRVASETNNGDFTLSIDGEDADEHTFTATGGPQDWETTGSIQAIFLTEGTHTLRITANIAGWNINWLQLQAQDFVSPCNLPLKYDGFTVKNEAVNWSSGLMNISCAASVDVCIMQSEYGTLSPIDSLNVYYKLDGGDLIEFSKSSGSLSETISFARELSGTTLEIIIKGASESTDNYYTINKISVIETADPFAKIEAEDYDEMNGVSSFGSYLGYIEQGEWSMYAGLDLTEVQSIDVSVGTAFSDVYIEVRLDSVDGPLFATINVPDTGKNTSYKTTSSYVNKVSGIYDVYLVYRKTEDADRFCNIDWLQLSDVFVKGPTEPYKRFEAEIYDGESGTVASATSDVDGNEELGNLEDGDFIMHKALNLEEADSIKVRVASAVDGGIIEVRLGSVTGEIIAFIDVPNTGSSGAWQTVSTPVDNVVGENDVYFVFRGEGSDLFKLNWLQFTKYVNTFDRLEADEYDSGSTSFFVGATSDADDNGVGSVIRFTYPGNWVQFDSIDLTGVKSVNARYGATNDDVYIEVRLEAFDGERIGIIDLENTGSYSSWQTASGNISAVSGVHDVFFVFKTKTSTVACSSNWFQLSGDSLPETLVPTARIEAEAYDRASGTMTIATTDVDGERELASIQNNDWILFKNINLTDLKSLDVRVASPYAGSRIEARLDAYDGPVFSYLFLPNTGSLTDWTTFNAKLFSIADGVHDVYLVFTGTSADFVNINWLQFKDISVGISKNNIGQDIQFFPNPAGDYLTINGNTNSKFAIFNALGQKVLEDVLKSNHYTFSLQGLDKGIYSIRVINDGTVVTGKLIKQ